MAALTSAHQQAATRILRYLKGTPGIFLPHNSTIQLKALCDSDWATCPNTHRSVTGFTVYLGSSLVSCSFEAEYRSLASTVCELQWLTYILHDLKHIDIDCHIVREKVATGLIKLLPISTTMQIADILTKLLPPPSFQLLRFKLGLQNIYAQLEGAENNYIVQSCVFTVRYCIYNRSVLC
ncbi:hypothetical protein V8G54_032440 [Vigna mungo]|uniref:Copia protein n=1 Tax=Vigna mungo TaxID=3915 RepID=A0AAQ3MLL2_VIGMU